MLTWTYCECGCHQHVIEVTRREGNTVHVLRTLFSRFDELRGADPQSDCSNGPYRLYTGHGESLVGTFNTLVEVDARAARILGYVIARLRVEVQGAQTKYEALRDELAMALALVPAEAKG